VADPVNLLADVVNRGFEWVKARSEYRRLSDSKRASESDQKRAANAALEAAARLEKALLQLMMVSGDKPLVRKKGKPLQSVDWGKLAGAISKGAGVVEDVLKKKGPHVQVIDTEGHEVD
jgi:hypothetical protein